MKTVFSKVVTNKARFQYLIVECSRILVICSDSEGKYNYRV